MASISSSNYFTKLTFSQERLVELVENDGRIRDMLISIQTILLPHLEVMQRDLISAKEVVERDPSLPTSFSLIDLVAMLEIKIQLLELVRNGWDHALAMILQFHKPFLDK